MRLSAWFGATLASFVTALTLAAQPTARADDEAPLQPAPAAEALITEPAPATPPAPVTVAQDQATTSEAEVAWVYGASDVFGTEKTETSHDALFADAQEVERLLGAHPAFIYQASELRSPMVIPWRRLEIVAYQLLEEATALIDQGQYEGAQALLARIVQDMPGSKVAADAKQRLDQVTRTIARVAMEESMRTQPKGSANAVKEERPFPRGVAVGVTGVLWSDSPRVVVNDAILDVGDTVPGYEEVTIKVIEKKSVTFAFDDRDFTIAIDASKAELPTGAKNSGIRD
jgi:hypothetical protein